MSGAYERSRPRDSVKPVSISQSRGLSVQAFTGTTRACSLPLFQSRNREACQFRLTITWLSTKRLWIVSISQSRCFSGQERTSPGQSAVRNVSISQSRGFSVQVSTGKPEFAFGGFQSRNRDAFHFRQAVGMKHRGHWI